MYRIDGNLFIILWVIVVAVLVFILYFSASDEFSFVWLGFGIIVGIAIAQSIDTFREKIYMKRYHNYR
jgi:hypothetical protein